MPPLSQISTRPSGFESFVSEALALPPAERVETFRRRVLDAYGGVVPASEQQAYAQALLRVTSGIVEARTTGVLDASINSARGRVVRLETELARVETGVKAAYEASRAAIFAANEKLATVLVDRRVREDDRVSAFFSIAANGQRAQRAHDSFAAHNARQNERNTLLTSLKSKQDELQATIETLRANEAALGASGDRDLELVLIAQKQQSLQALLGNLQDQIALLKTMVGSATDMRDAFLGVQASLEKMLAETSVWVEQVKSDNADLVLSRVFDVASFVAMSALPAPALVAMMIVRGVLLEDVEGARETAELFIWRTISRLLTRGLVEAGVGEAAARTLVAALRTAASTPSLDDRTAAAALVRGAIGEGQRIVIDFLLRDADPALPLVALTKAILSLATLSTDDAHRIVASLAQAGRGVDGALTILEEAAGMR